MLNSPLMLTPQGPFPPFPDSLSTYIFLYIKMVTNIASREARADGDQNWSPAWKRNPTGPGETQRLEARSKFADSSSSPMMLFSVLPLPQPQLAFTCKKSLFLQSELLEDPRGLQGAGGQLSKPGSRDR